MLDVANLLVFMGMEAFDSYYAVGLIDVLDHSLQIGG